LQLHPSLSAFPQYLDAFNVTVTRIEISNNIQNITDSLQSMGYFYEFFLRYNYIAKGEITESIKHTYIIMHDRNNRRQQ
jgi:hypothetical protein